jgi:hypothetical protein
MEHLEETAVRHGIERLDLRATVGATGFYRSSGYTAIRVVEKSIGDARFRMVIMEKVLCAALGGA